MPCRQPDNQQTLVCCHMTWHRVCGTLAPGSHRHAPLWRTAQCNISFVDLIVCSVVVCSVGGVWCCAYHAKCRICGNPQCQRCPALTLLKQQFICLQLLGDGTRSPSLQPDPTSITDRCLMHLRQMKFHKNKKPLQFNCNLQLPPMSLP